ncbi:MAG TPA: hypothetical protein VLI06_19750 [Solimonas sp.]|nr:hypothetical protein [Solimonas sp.]
MSGYRHIRIPATREKVSVRNGKPEVPDQLVIGYVEGDGIGPDIPRADGGQRKTHWCETFLGEKVAGLYDGNYCPDETLKVLQDLVISIKWSKAVAAITQEGGASRLLHFQEKN